MRSVISQRGKFKSRIMDGPAIERALQRMAHQILERNPRLDEVALIGIRRRGEPLARRMAAIIHSLEGVLPPVGVLDITLYEDDLTQIATHPVLNRTEIPFEISGMTIVLLDDVLYTGRTIRAALNALFDVGHPQRVEVAVLIDRGHRSLPIHADYVGKSVPTAAHEVVHVMIKEIDGEDQVLLGENE